MSRTPTVTASPEQAAQLDQLTEHEAARADLRGGRAAGPAGGLTPGV